METYLDSNQDASIVKTTEWKDGSDEVRTGYIIRYGGSRIRFIEDFLEAVTFYKNCEGKPS